MPAGADLTKLLRELRDDETGGLLAAPGADTLKYGPTLGASAVERTVDRTGLWRALTPQMFRFGALRKALEAAHDAGRTPTDESQALEWVGARPLLVEGSAANIKVTTAQDLVVAAAILSSRQQARISDRSRPCVSDPVLTCIAFGDGDFVMLGGVRVPYGRGVIAHSDGDVILHALCDALLGAAGLGDIGQHFRDDDPTVAGRGQPGIRARRPGHAARAQARGGQCRYHRAGRGAAAVAASRADPPQHRARCSRWPPECVNVKATTTEKMGFLGRGEGLAAQAVVLLRTSA